MPCMETNLKERVRAKTQARTRRMEIDHLAHIAQCRNQDCLENNKEKRDEWERKNHIEKKKNGAKDEGNDSKSYFDLVAFSMPAKSNTISRDRWLFDTGADEHIANSLEKFDTYEERMDLPFMNTANGLVRP
jgi:hypothetical protein